jgi:hypothetical protein
MTRSRFNYYRRIVAAYLTSRPSQLTFWHEVPAVNPNWAPGELGEYYMTFHEKADYPGPYDRAGVPLLNYHGAIGCQYNPIAIAQYGLGNWNFFKQRKDPVREEKFLTSADWLAANLERNSHGLPVWHHHFDWDYRTMLKAPWFSGLAQGQGVSVLVRAYRHTGNQHYLQAAHDAFRSFLKPIEEGGVVHYDGAGDPWFEEYIVDPPTHILNGLIWALWGVYDFFLMSANPVAWDLFAETIRTLVANLHRYDTGSWSLYDLPGTRIQNRASPYYHELHIVQLLILSRLTGHETFQAFADRWQAYQASYTKRLQALAWKSAFKLLHY